MLWKSLIATLACLSTTLCCCVPGSLVSRLFGESSAQVRPMTACEAVLNEVEGWDDSILGGPLVRHLALSAQPDQLGVGFHRDHIPPILGCNGSIRESASLISRLHANGIVHGEIRVNSFGQETPESRCQLTRLPWNAFLICETDEAYFGVRSSRQDWLNLSPWQSDRPGFRDDAFQFLQLVSDRIYPGRLESAIGAILAENTSNQVKYTKIIRLKRTALLFSPSSGPTGTRPVTPITEDSPRTNSLAKMEQILSYVRSIPMPTTPVLWEVLLEGFAELDNIMGFQTNIAA